MGHEFWLLPINQSINQLFNGSATKYPLATFRLPKDLSMKVRPSEARIVDSKRYHHDKGVFARTMLFADMGKSADQWIG
jgi:hypothetical protein